MKAVVVLVIRAPEPGPDHRPRHARARRGARPGARYLGQSLSALLCEGGFAEYVSVRQDLPARKPANLSHEQTAAVPMAPATALLAVRDEGGSSRASASR